MAEPADDFRTHLRQQAEHLEERIRALEEYLSTRAHQLTDKVAAEIRSDIKMLKDLIAKWRA